MRLTPLALLLAVAVAPAAEETAPSLTFRPNTVEIEHSLQFDDNGRSRAESSNLTIQLGAAIAPADAAVVGYSALAFTEIATDSGEKLTATDMHGGAQRIDQRMRRFRPNGPAFTVHARMAAPRKPAGRIATLAGTIDLQIAAGAPKSAEITPIKDFVGKRLQIEGVDGAEVTITDHDDQRIELSMPESTERRLAEITFADAAGNACEAGGWGGGSDNDIINRTYHVSVPANGTITLKFHQDVRTVTVPFTVADIRLPGGPAEAKPADAVIKAKETPAAKPAPAGALKVKPQGEF